MSYATHLLGWVALQSAWQTLAVALLLVWSLRWMREEPASRRCRWAVMHLWAVVAALVVTLLVSHASVALAHPPASTAGLQDRISGFLPALAWIWLAGTAAGPCLLAVRWLCLRRFLTSSKPATPDVVAAVEAISGAMCLRRPPRVLSADIGCPLVAGDWPAILVVPRTFAETYPPAEMRALLAHELAHVLRRDYSGNILHLLALSLLWWHPGAWLIYARIRHECECASDEHAVRHGVSAASLAHALFRLAAAPAATADVTVAAGPRGLADRVSRMAETRQYRGRKTIPYFPAAAFAALTAIIIGLCSTASRSESLTTAYASSAVGPNTLFTIHAHDPAGNFLVKMVRGRVLTIELGERPVPSDRVVQRGRMVTVVGAGGQEVLRFEVDPRGGLRWKPRQPS